MAPNEELAKRGVASAQQRRLGRDALRAAAVLVLIGAAGCGPTIPASRNQQTVNRLRALNDELREERESHLQGEAGASRSARAAAPARTAAPAKGEAEPDDEQATKDDPQPEDQAGTADEGSTDDDAPPAMSKAARELLVDHSGVERAAPTGSARGEDDPQAGPTTTVRVRGAAAQSADAASGWNLLARQLAAARSDLNEDKRRWEVRRLQDEIKALQDARLRDTLYLSRGVVGIEGKAGASDSAALSSVVRELNAMKQQQTDIGRLLTDLRKERKDQDVEFVTVRDPKTGKLVKRRRRTPLAEAPGDPALKSRLDKLHVELKEVRTALARLKSGGAAPGAGAAAGDRGELRRLRDDVRDELKRMRSLRDDLGRRPAAGQSFAPAAAVQLSGPAAAGRSSAPAPAARARPALSPPRAKAELEAQLELADQMLRAQMKQEK